MLDCMTLTLSYFHIFLHRHSTLLTLLVSGDLTPLLFILFPLNCFLKAKPDVSYQQILASQIHNIGIQALSPTFMLAVMTLCPNIKLSNPRNNIFTLRGSRPPSPHSRSSGNLCHTRLRAFGRDTFCEAIDWWPERNSFGWMVVWLFCNLFDCETLKASCIQQFRFVCKVSPFVADQYEVATRNFSSRPRGLHGLGRDFWGRCWGR